MTGPRSGQDVIQAWHAHRPYLIDLAFRMLGDIGAAEDVVQDAFSRLLRTAPGDATGIEFIDDASPGTSTADPADRVTLDDSIRLALLVVLQRLSPAERVVFVLHDIFAVPYGSIAQTVGRPVAGCRQLARRPRQKIEAAQGGARYDVAVR